MTFSDRGQSGIHACWLGLSKRFTYRPIPRWKGALLGRLFLVYGLSVDSATQISALGMDFDTAYGRKPPAASRNPIKKAHFWPVEGENLSRKLTFGSMTAETYQKSTPLCRPSSPSLSKSFTFAAYRTAHPLFEVGYGVLAYQKPSPLMHESCAGHEKLHQNYSRIRARPHEKLV